MNCSYSKLSLLLVSYTPFIVNSTTHNIITGWSVPSSKSLSLYIYRKQISHSYTVSQTVAIIKLPNAQPTN